MSDLVLLLTAIIPTTVFGVWWVLRPVPDNQARAPQEEMAILFKHGVVEHASDSALAELPIVIGAQNWHDLHDILHEHYPDFPPEPLAPMSAQTIVAGGCGQTHRIQIDWNQSSTAITFHETDKLTRSIADLEELDTLRQVNALSPYPVWKTNDAGSVLWCNTAYAALAAQRPELPHADTQQIFDLPALSGSQTVSRAKIDTANAPHPEWFDVSRQRVEEGIINHATPLAKLIKAEEAQRDFVQALAKTFAHLSIGLAIFSRDRQLALFNPALIDLTGLSASFLSPRPTIDSFFDALRENRRMPEPKNYKTWRHRMADLVNAAERGSFEETWSLETGQTYSVKGRPHPDGAIAFLIEDITSEVSLTRNFRAELELGQSLADTFDDAIAVFSKSGVLTFSNKAYDTLWGVKFDTSFADTTINDAIRVWKGRTTANPLWQALSDFVVTHAKREPWDMPVNISGGAQMVCRIVPIAAGATVVRFTDKATARPQSAKAMSSS